MIGESIKRSLKYKRSNNKEKPDRAGRGHDNPCFNFSGFFLTKSFRVERQWWEGQGTSSEILQTTKSKETVKFSAGEANSGIKWISLLYRNLGNAAACAFVVITQQQQGGFPSPRNIWACALPQNSRKEQRRACCFSAPGCLISRGGRDWHFTESWCGEHVGNEKATRLITHIISTLSPFQRKRGKTAWLPNFRWNCHLMMAKGGPFQASFLLVFKCTSSTWN